MSKKAVLIIVIVIVVVFGGIGIALAVHGSKKTAPIPATTTNPATVNNSIIKTKSSSILGNYLANPSGNSLYTYGADTSGVSNCSGSCLATWPAYSPTSSTSATLPTNITLITRSDGTKQYAYKGMPLYVFTGDTNGQVNGDGVGDFSVAKP